MAVMAERQFMEGSKSGKVGHVGKVAVWEGWQDRVDGYGE